MSIGEWAYWGQHSGGACKDSRISFSISITLLPLSLNSLSFSLNRLGDNIGISMISIGDSWGLNLNSFDCRLHNWCSVDIGIRMVKSIGQIVGISLGISFGLTLLPLSLNSLSFGFSLNGLGDDPGISMIPKSVRVDSMVTKVVWVSVGVGNGRCLNFHLLYNRLNKGGGINIWAVNTICQIVGISLSISLSIGLTLLPFGSLHSGSLSLSGSSGSSSEWDGERESMSPETIERSMKIRVAVGDKWSSLSLSLSGLYFNRLYNRDMGNCMVSIDKGRVDKARVDEELRISLSICTDSSKEGNHQQEFHVVTAL